MEENLSMTNHDDDVNATSSLETDEHADSHAGTDDGVEKDEAVEESLTVGQAIKKGLRETVDTFKALKTAPREIIGVNVINIIEGMAYFGTLTYLVLFMSSNIGLGDIHASYVVTAFMMTVTISQLLFGGISDRLGAKKALGVALIVLVLGRFIVGFSESVFGSAGTGLWSPIFWVVSVALLVVGLAYGLYQPAIYSVTRQYSDEKTSAVSYALLYAGMNLGAFMIGLALPHIRKFSSDMMGGNGYSGSLIFIAAIMLLAAFAYIGFIVLSRNKPIHPAKDENAEGQETAKSLSLTERLKRHPLADLRFDFFIFILIPVQTLFAYQNILIPAYLERCYTAYPSISGNFETFSNLNPLIVFVAAPVIAALTARANVYKMMIIGTMVMAVPTFLLCIGEHPVTFLTFVLLMSIGESMWQPRFLQHVAEIAPKDKVGAYMGIAQLPWFLTKFIVGLYAGHAMASFIPELTDGVTQNPQLMWFIFACVAMISPVALILAKNWMNPKKSA